MKNKLWFLFFITLILGFQQFSYSQLDTMWTVTGGFSNAVFIDNFTKVAGSGSDLHIYDSQTGKQIFRKYVGLIFANGISNGKELLFLDHYPQSYQTDTVFSYDVNNDQVLSNYIDTTMPFPEYQGIVWTLNLHNVDFCQKLNYLAISYSSGLIGTNDSNRVKINIYDLNTNKLIKSINLNQSFSEIIKFSQDGNYLAIAYKSISNIYVQIFDTKTWENKSENIIKTNHSFSYDILGLSISPNSKYIVTSSQDGSEEILDIFNHNIYKTYYPSPSQPTSSYFTNDTTAIFGYAGNLSLINIITGKIIWLYSFPQGFGVLKLQYDSTNDRILVSSPVSIALLYNITTSIPNNNSSQNIQTIFPNPVNNTVTIPLGNKMIYSDVQIVDITGKIVLKIPITPQINSSGFITINVVNFSPGIYFINLNSSNSVQTYKMIKEK